MAERRSPLADLAERMAAVAGGDSGLALRELPFLAQLNVRADLDDTLLAHALAAALGCALPTEPNTVATGSGERRVLWLGPDEWLVVAPAGEEPALERELRAAMAGRFGAVTDVSANRTTLELAGARVREVLMTGCALDLHPRAFGPGRCAQTTLARAQAIVERSGADAFRLYVRPSFAGYVVTWLLDAIAGLGVAEPDAQPVEPAPA